MPPEDVLELPRTDVEGLYRQQISREINEAIVVAIRNAYRDAPAMAKSFFRRDQATEVGPRLRRAHLESALLNLSQFEGVRTDSIKSSGSSYYVEMEVGDLMLIAARALDPDKMIPKAAYRTRIALAAAQRDLFDDEPIEAGARFYAVILHGSSKGQIDPAFIQVRFPTRDHQTYLETRIDLRAEYRHLFDEHITPIERITDTTILTLRSQVDTGTSDVAT
jgi:hypothetical protein